VLEQALMLTGFVHTMLCHIHNPSFYACLVGCLSLQCSVKLCTCFCMLVPCKSYAMLSAYVPLW
jgi:hypothetical protein